MAVDDCYFNTPLCWSHALHIVALCELRPSMLRDAHPPIPTLPAGVVDAMATDGSSGDAEAETA